MNEIINFFILLTIEVEYDAQRDEKEQHEAKMKEVRQVEELRKQKEAESRRKISLNHKIFCFNDSFKNLENTKENDKNDTLVERIQLQIIRNLELSIKNIHIVYEDKSTKPNHPFSFGITLNYIILHVSYQENILT